jgi:hypothetical protein
MGVVLLIMSLGKLSPLSLYVALIVLQLIDIAMTYVAVGVLGIAGELNPLMAPFAGSLPWLITCKTVDLLAITVILLHIRKHYNEFLVPILAICVGVMSIIVLWNVFQYVLYIWMML